MKRQTTRASNENCQDTPMKNISSKRKASISYTEKNNDCKLTVKCKNRRKRYVQTWHRLEANSEPENFKNPAKKTWESNF